MTEEKRCTKCGKTKPLEDYHRRPDSRDGRMSQCRACRNAKGQAWRKENPDYGKAWRDRHPGHNKAWREGDVDYFAAWDAARPKYHWAGDYRRRAARYGFEPTVESFTRADVIGLYGDQCWHCEAAPFEELDHYPTPVAAGGAHTLENVRPACTDCNAAGSWPARAMREELLAAA